LESPWSVRSRWWRPLAGPFVCRGCWLPAASSFSLFVLQRSPRFAPWKASCCWKRSGTRYSSRNGNPRLVRPALTPTVVPTLVPFYCLFINKCEGRHGHLSRTDATEEHIQDSVGLVLT
jgi:hypothetical protein